MQRLSDTIDLQGSDSDEFAFCLSSPWTQRGMLELSRLMDDFT